MISPRHLNGFSLSAHKDAAFLSFMWLFHADCFAGRAVCGDLLLSEVLHVVSALFTVTTKFSVE
jgi:hypothetical protein